MNEFGEVEERGFCITLADIYETKKTYRIWILLEARIKSMVEGESKKRCIVGGRLSSQSISAMPIRQLNVSRSRL